MGSVQMDEKSLWWEGFAKEVVFKLRVKE